MNPRFAASYGEGVARLHVICRIALNRSRNGKGQDSWSTILAAIPQDCGAILASKVETLQGWAES